MTMLKFLTAASTLLLIGACSDQQMKAKHIDAAENQGLAGNASEMLPLEPRLISEQNIDDKKSSNRMHVMALGNWLVSCNYTNRAGQKTAICGIVPWNGKLVSGMAVPLSAGPQVNLGTARDPSAEIRGPGRYGEQAWSFSCGSLKLKSEDGKKVIRLRSNREAAPLIQRLKSSDCELGYTGKTGEAETIAFTKHGFSEAHQYAKRYVTSPK